jgi:hypothetical protein
LELLLQLPLEFVSKRVTKRLDLPAYSTVDLFSEEGSGCIRHWWLTHRRNCSSEQLHLRIITDDASVPNIEMPLSSFFGVLLGLQPYKVESAYIRVLPKNGFNCYFPILFGNKCKIQLTNTTSEAVSIWFMADWQEYECNVKIPALRFGAINRTETPAKHNSFYEMAKLTGRGIVAGFFKGIHVQDSSDRWYHTGGDLWLLDGETNPHLLRGIGVEDVFGYSFGVEEGCGLWTGAPHLVTDPAAPRQDKEIVAYRLFGPDPVVFKDSIVFRMGSKANDVESVV